MNLGRESQLSLTADDGNFRRFNVVGTRASDIAVYTVATTSFGLKLRIEKVRGNKITAAVSSLRHLSVPPSYSLFLSLT